MAPLLQITLRTVGSVVVVAVVQGATKTSIERSARPYGQLLDLLVIPFGAYLFTFTDFGLSTAAILIGLVEFGIILGAHRAKLGEWHPDGIRWVLEHGMIRDQGGVVRQYRVRVAFQMPAGVSDHEKAITLHADSAADALMRLKAVISQHIPDGAPANIAWRVLDVRESPSLGRQ